MRLLGILGGTYDPVHHGHLRAALELKAGLQLSSVRLIPVGTPPHRAAPVASGAQRLAMLQAAVQGEPGLLVDDRELRRPGPSYTVDTLRELKAEHQSNSLCLALGSDAFMALHTWHQWEEIFALAHIIVWHRPHWELDSVWQALHPAVQTRVAAGRVREAQALATVSSGLIYFLPIPDLDISASRIRALAAAGSSIRYLVPEAIRRQVIEIYGKEETV